jgi:cytochrome P450
MPALTYTLATIYETIRLRDIVMTLPKLAAEDAFIPYTTWDSFGIITESRRLVKKGSHIIIDSPACQRNPRFWADPNKFDPTRHFSNAAAKSAFTGFSMGVRQCIGKRFAEVEMVALLSQLVRRFLIQPVPLEGETFEALKQRYEKGSEELSFTPDKWDIRLERREP